MFLFHTDIPEDIAARRICVSCFVYRCLRAARTVSRALSDSVIAWSRRCCRDAGTVNALDPGDKRELHVIERWLAEKRHRIAPRSRMKLQRQAQAKRDVSILSFEFTSWNVLDERKSRSGNIVQGDRGFCPQPQGRRRKPSGGRIVVGVARPGRKRPSRMMPPVGKYIVDGDREISARDGWGDRLHCRQCTAKNEYRAADADQTTRSNSFRVFRGRRIRWADLHCWDRCSSKNRLRQHFGHRRDDAIALYARGKA